MLRCVGGTPLLLADVGLLAAGSAVLAELGLWGLRACGCCHQVQVRSSQWLWDSGPDVPTVLPKECPAVPNQGFMG